MADKARTTFPRLPLWILRKFILLLLPVFLLSACGLSSLESRKTDDIPNESAGSPKSLPTPTLMPTQTPQPTATPAAGIRSAYRHLTNGDWDAARTAFEAVQSQARDSAPQTAALLGLGRTNYEAGDYNLALINLRKIVDAVGSAPTGSDLPKAYFLLGRTYAALQRYPEAADAFHNYLKRNPGAIDSYAQELLGDALARAGDPTGALAAYQAARSAPRAGSLIPLDIKIARATATNGDFSTAVVMYDDIYNRAEDLYTKAQMRLLKGSLLAAQGQQDEAFAAYLDTVANHPQAYDSYSALVELVNAGYEVDEVQRGIVDYYAGEYGAASAVFERYLYTGGGDANAHATALYYKGLTHQSRGEYPAAIRAWDTLIQDYPKSPFYYDAWDQKATTLWVHMEQYPKALEVLLDFVKKYPQDAHAPDFLLTAGRVAERSGDLEQSARLWERVALEYPSFEQAMRATYLAGVIRYRLTQFAEARSDMERTLGMTADQKERAAILLWIGKCQKASGDLSAARSSWEQAAAADPSGYYSERARQLLGGDSDSQRNPFTPPPDYRLESETAAERLGAELWLKDTFHIAPETSLDGPGALLDDQRLWRGTTLWGLGLYDEANGEFASLQEAVKDNPESTYRLAIYLADLGSYKIAILAARRVLDLAGMDDAGTLQAPVFFNRLRFGLYYQDLFVPAAQEFGFHPLFLFAVARQESMFEGLGHSHAGARGLMQIIPDTGQNLADQLQYPPHYTSEDLFRPNVSVKFGSYYLSKLSTMFQGDLYAALAAYNGGPGNARMWKELAPDDPDLFLESIRFEETRNYIRYIYEMYVIYRQLYGVYPS